MIDNHIIVSNKVATVGVFTSKKSPAELSLHSVINLCLLIWSGHRRGSLDSNGSITCTHTHARTHSDSR